MAKAPGVEPMAATVVALLERYAKLAARAKTPERMEHVFGELQGALHDAAHAAKHWSEVEVRAVMDAVSDVDPFNVAGRVSKDHVLVPDKAVAWLTNYTAKWVKKLRGRASAASSRRGRST